MAVKIRLKRMGKIRQPYYRLVVVDSRKKRDGKVIEEIGKYHPKQEPSYIEVVSERAQYWLGVGAQPSDAVAAILKITGDWQKFRGEPGAEGTLRVAEPKRDKTELFNEALKDAANEPKSGATTAKKTAKKAAAKKVEDEAPAETDAETDAEKAATAEVEEAVAEQGPNPADAATTEEAAEESTDGSADTTEAEAEADEKAETKADEKA